MKQCLDFENEIAPCKFCLFFDCGEEILTKRLLGRAQTSGRVDDNIDVIKKRFVTYREQTLPVIEYFEANGRVRKVTKIF